MRNEESMIKEGRLTMKNCAGMRHDESMIKEGRINMKKWEEMRMRRV
jgi:hypothetical protein